PLHCTALWAFVQVLHLQIASELPLDDSTPGPNSSELHIWHFQRQDSAEMYERRAEESGVVYKIPGVLGQTRIVLCDPKAIAHFYARESWIY
ncbi:hypothetical protein M405DRAFT_123438, partial [Rhizopogon salebrosus TDB-379]